MNVVGAVTAGAAGLAAVLAGVNLYVSGRREMDKWTRETVVEIFVAFLTASFKHGAVCRSLFRDAPADPGRQHLRADVVAVQQQQRTTWRSMPSLGCGCWLHRA
jgi:hypothetical protein